MPDNRTSHVAEAWRIFALAWPITLTSLNWTLMHIIDVAVIGHYGTAELAAFGASRVLTFIGIVLGYAGLTGVLVFTSRADGAGDLAKTGDTFRSGLILGFVVGSLLALLLGLFAVELLTLFGVEESLRVPGGAVVSAMAIAFPAQFIQAAASFFLEGISRPRRVLTVNALQLPVNAVLAWAWVGGHFGLPPLGAVGAAYATAAASWFGAVLVMVLILALPRAAARGVRDWSGAALRRAAAGVPKLAWFGLVPAIAASLELAGFAWLMVLSTQLGYAAAAAFQAMLSLHNVVFALSMGFASAAGVRVGNAVGAEEWHAIWPRASIAAALTTAIVGLTSMLLVGFAVILVRPFSDDPAVLTLAATMLTVMACFLIFDALQYLYAYSLRSLGEQVWAGINGIVGFFLVTGGLGWLLVQRGWGPEGLAWAAAGGMVVTALLNFARFAYRVRWRARS